MPTFAYYDHTGAIHSVAHVDAPHGKFAMMTPRAGLLAAEIEGISLTSRTPVPDELRAIAASHTIAGAVPRCRLRKSD